MIKTLNDYPFTLIRGDSFCFGINLHADITLDRATFTVREKWNSESICFQLTIDNGITHLGSGKYSVHIPAEATANMEPGKYVYDLELKYQDEVKTPLRGIFKLAEDATY